MSTLYTAVTFILILSGLVQAAILPLTGALSALAVLVALILKMVLGNLRAKAEAMTGGFSPQTLKGPTGKGIETGKTTAGKAGGATGGAMKGGGTGAAAKANIWALIIDYFTSPMSQAEKIALAFGWILLPIAASIPFAILIGLAKYICDANLLTQAVCSVAQKLF